MPVADLKLVGLKKEYGSVAVIDGVDLEVNSGTLLSLLGPSGCGKTTLLRTIAGLLAPSDGDILLRGTSVRNIPVHKRGVGMLFQDYALFPHMTVMANVQFGLEMRLRDKRRNEALALEALEMVQLVHLAKRYPHELSGGQRQRVALARAIVIEPALLLLDEPFGALDKNLRKEMQMQLRDIQTNLKITTIMVTHDQEEAMSISDQVAVMRNGRIAQCGSPADIYMRPESAFVAEFVGASNMMQGRVTQHDGNNMIIETGSGLRLSAARITDAIDVTVMMRPESIHMEVTERTCPNELDQAYGTIARVVYRGTVIEYSILLPSSHTLDCLRPSSPGCLDIGVGTMVKLTWAAKNARVLHS